MPTRKSEPTPESEVVTVIPSPNLSALEYVPGIGAAGKALPIEEAQPLLDAGLVVLKPAPLVKPAPDKEKD